MFGGFFLVKYCNQFDQVFYRNNTQALVIDYRIVRLYSTTLLTQNLKIFLYVSFSIIITANPKIQKSAREKQNLVVDRFTRYNSPNSK